MTASIFAIEGYLNFWLVAGVAFAGVILGDMTWYCLGRYSKETKIGNWVNKKFEKHQGWLVDNIQNHYARFVFLSKFLYYVNRITPLLAGWQKMDFKKFFKTHLIAGSAWVVTMAIVGKFFGLIIIAIGTKKVFRGIHWFFIGLAALVIGGDFLLKRLFVKKVIKH